MSEFMPKIDIKWLPVPERIMPPVVEWSSFNRDERGIALIGTEYVNEELHMELYADGTVRTKNKSGKIEKTEKIKLDLLREAVDNYKKNNGMFNIIRIGDLLKKSTTESE